ncbi:MAG: Sec-independent protein translocase protein TatB [Rhodospirillaceae bacterium]|nr:Sec-independent protein translocase protein TatB [Rhodospirillaceae bacterium]
MFDIGWAELAVIGVVALIVVGPKDLPVVLRTGAHWLRQARKLSREFQSGVDSIVREADLDDAKKIVTSARQGTLKRQIETAIDPTGEMKRSLDPKAAMSDTDAEAKRKAAAKTATPNPATPAIAAPTGTDTAATPASTVDAAPSATVAPESPAAGTPVVSPADKAAPAAAPVEPARNTGS